MKTLTGPNHSSELTNYRDLVIEEQKNLIALCRNVPGLIYQLRLTSDGVVTAPFVSDAVLHVWGISPDVLAQDASRLVDGINEADRVTWLALQERSRQTGDSFTFQFQYRHPFRGEIWLEISATPESRADGATVCHGFCSDISERKNIEEGIAEASKREAIERLAGGIAHDFNNYLGSSPCSSG